MFGTTLVAFFLAEMGDKTQIAVAGMGSAADAAPTWVGATLALATTSELLKAASSNVLRFKTSGTLPPALAARARVTGTVVQLPAHNALEIEQYLAAVRESGLVVEDVEMRKADLEDVFIDIMNRHSHSPSDGGSGATPAQPAPAVGSTVRTATSVEATTP